MFRLSLNFILFSLLLLTTSCGVMHKIEFKRSKQQQLQPRISESIAYDLLGSTLQGNYICSENIHIVISFKNKHRINNVIEFESRVRTYKSNTQLSDNSIKGIFNLDIGVLFLDSTKANLGAGTRSTEVVQPPPYKFSLVLGRDLKGKGWEGYVEDSRFDNCYKAALTGQSGYTTSEIPTNLINPKDAFETSAKMNEKRYPWHLYLLHIAARHGNANARNYLTVLTHFMKQAEQGNVDALYALGELYSNGDVLYWKYGKMLRAYDNTSLAKLYGLYTLPGYIQQVRPSNGLSRNIVFGAYWYRKAAEHGSVLAQRDLGYYYNQVKSDNVQAIIWYSKAAEQGDAEAQYRLGDIYLNGYRIKHDPKLGIPWIRKSANQGFLKAQNALGFLYEHGRGVPLDFTKAEFWYRKGADRRNSSAQYHLGLLYYSGKGVLQNYTQAALWYRKAARQGVYDAALALSKMYQNGIGVKQNSEQAAYWYEKSKSPVQQAIHLGSGVIDAMIEAQEEENRRRKY